MDVQPRHHYHHRFSLVAFYLCKKLTARRSEKEKIKCPQASPKVLRWESSRSLPPEGVSSLSRQEGCSGCCDSSTLIPCEIWPFWTRALCWYHFAASDKPPRVYGQKRVKNVTDGPFEWTKKNKKCWELWTAKIAKCNHFRPIYRRFIYFQILRMRWHFRMKDEYTWISKSVMMCNWHRTVLAGFIFRAASVMSVLLDIVSLFCISCTRILSGWGCGTTELRLGSRRPERSQVRDKGCSHTYIHPENFATLPR